VGLLIDRQSQKRKSFHARLRSQLFHHPILNRENQKAGTSASSETASSEEIYRALQARTYASAATDCATSAAPSEDLSPAPGTSPATSGSSNEGVPGCAAAASRRESKALKPPLLPATPVAQGSFQGSSEAAQRKAVSKHPRGHGFLAQR
jgi:hypothetical protein